MSSIRPVVGVVDVSQSRMVDLINRGMPVLFVTGYGEAGVPEKFRRIPLLSKPFQQRDLEKAVAKAPACKASVRADGSEPSPM
jgi:FixJ family two-component response regulator